MAVPDAEILFQDTDLMVRHLPGDSTAQCVVTFAPLNDNPALTRPGFGEGFFRARGIPAIHVVPRGNHWYQYPGTLAATAAIRAAVRPYARVLAYGSSMGAYAALRLGAAAGAHAALALSPQFSIRPARVPFEYRWSALGRTIEPVWEDTFPIPQWPEAYLVYDPRDLDARHAALYAAATPTIPIRLPGAGHPVTGFLNGAGLLQDLALRACAGPLDATTLEGEAWAARRLAPQYYRYLAERSTVPAWQLAALRRAVALAPSDAGLMSRLARVLGQAGRFDEALDLHRQTLAQWPGLAPLLAEYATTLDASGDRAGALTQLEQMHAQGRTDVLPRIAALRAHLVPASGRTAARRPTLTHDPGAAPALGTPPSIAWPGESGFVLHGPFLELKPGRYTVTFTVGPQRDGLQEPGPQEDRPSRQTSWLLGWRTACMLDVAIHDGQTVLARHTLSVAAVRGGICRVTLPFTMPEWTACQFRVRTTGRTGLSIQPHRPVRRRM